MLYYSKKSQGLKKAHNQPMEAKKQKDTNKLATERGRLRCAIGSVMVGSCMASFRRADARDGAIYAGKAEHRQDACRPTPLVGHRRRGGAKSALVPPSD